MRIIVTLLLLTLLPSPAFAQEYVIFNGGISQEERASAPSQGVRLVFYARGGSFVADVSVRVSDESGTELVNTVTTGPWLILDLPAGQYRVAAELAGEPREASFTADGTSKEVSLMFSKAQ